MYSVCYNGSVCNYYYRCLLQERHEQLCTYYAMWSLAVSTIMQWRVKEFGFWFSIFQGGGPAQKIAEKMIFPNKKVAKYR